MTTVWIYVDTSYKGTKLWAGDCVASELRGATTAPETESLPEQAPPDQKQ
jgi:hypothetical protein